MHTGHFFLIAILIAVTAKALMKMWLRAQQGLPIEDRQHRRYERDMRRMHRRWGNLPHFAAMTGRGGGDLDAERKIHLLTDENEKLVGKIGRLEERLAVLERIATDPAERTAREIDALRDR